MAQTEVYMRLTCDGCEAQIEGWLPGFIQLAPEVIESWGWRVHTPAQFHRHDGSFDPATDKLYCPACKAERVEEL